jgi:hypothetical protein
MTCPRSRASQPSLFVALALAAGLWVAGCSSQSTALRTDAPQTFTAQIVSIGRNADTNRPDQVTFSVTEYATVNERLPVLKDLDGRLVTENMNAGLAEGDKVELFYDERMPPDGRKSLEVGEKVTLGVKYLDVTPPVFIGGE